MERCSHHRNRHFKKEKLKSDISSIQVCLSEREIGVFFPQRCSFHHIRCQTVLDFTQRKRRPLQQPPLRGGSYPYCNWMVALLLDLKPAHLPDRILNSSQRSNTLIIQRQEISPGCILAERVGLTFQLSLPYRQMNCV